MYDFIVDSSGYTVTSDAAATITNDVTIQAGTFNISANLEINAMTVDSGAIFNISSSSTFTMNSILTLNGNFNLTSGSAIDVNLSGTKFNLTSGTNIGLHTYGSIPSAPANRYTIGKYVNLSSIGSGSTVDLNITYTSSDVGSVVESTLVIYEYNETTSTWTQASTTGVNTDANYVYANSITSFSGYGPLGNKTNKGIISKGSAAYSLEIRQRKM